MAAMLEELARYSSVQVHRVDTRLPTHYRKKRLLFAPETVRRAVFITGHYLQKIAHSDAILVFANNAFILTLVPLLFGLARWYGKPFYLKPIGGDLDLYLAAQKKPIRTYALRVLRAMDGILPQTRQLQAVLAQWGCANVYYIPGCRPVPSQKTKANHSSKQLRLIFLSQIKPEKGTLVLLESLRRLAEEERVPVTCDFFGPVYEESQEAFFKELAATPGARYGGVVAAGAASSLMAGYDALVLPTHFVSEGHPGVIIEAMQAGVPVISTYHRAIPELINPGENGFLVPVQNSSALAQAIAQLARDPSLRQRLGRANSQQAQSFRADVVVPQLLEIVFPTRNYLT
jgi:glycosyltransferase involved in cell wall biosynthesis